ncbi:hypothetical protein MB14_04140 [Roseivirga ehrenbergii]|uniref:HYR domain-containing protein n=2 Tax=Roseivirga ehrenbergii (strain DSM 102268 / JCM 13514 / KCTC 12282 / NCIMB 14502 / KMM 6017) TaxID=279360 RepID=A0A150X6N7_ROSEK|nr:hypothetical protein MB14_04140 [Roseivirga ehrenbergii]
MLFTLQTYGQDLSVIPIPVDPNNPSTPFVVHESAPITLKAIIRNATCTSGYDVAWDVNRNGNFDDDYVRRVNRNSIHEADISRTFLVPNVPSEEDMNINVRVRSVCTGEEKFGTFRLRVQDWAPSSDPRSWTEEQIEVLSNIQIQEAMAFVFRTTTWYNGLNNTLNAWANIPQSNHNRFAIELFTKNGRIPAFEPSIAAQYGLSSDNISRNDQIWASDPYANLLGRLLNRMASRTAFQSGIPSIDENNLAGFNPDGSEILGTRISGTTNNRGIFSNEANGADQGRVGITGDALSSISSLLKTVPEFTFRTGTLNGLTLAQVAQEIVDYLTFAQIDGGAGQGGFYYQPLNGNYNHNYPRQDIAMAVLKGLREIEIHGKEVGIIVNNRVKYRYLNNFVTNQHNDGGAQWTSGRPNGSVNYTAVVVGVAHWLGIDQMDLNYGAVPFPGYTNYSKGHFQQAYSRYVGFLNNKWNTPNRKTGIGWSDMFYRSNDYLANNTSQAFPITSDVQSYNLYNVTDGLLESNADFSLNNNQDWQREFQIALIRAQGRALDVNNPLAQLNIFGRVFDNQVYHNPSTAYGAPYNATNMSAIALSVLANPGLDNGSEVDTEPPVVSTQNITAQLDANGNATITPQQVDNGSIDNSGGSLTYALDQTSFDCDDLSTECTSGSLKIDGQNDQIILPNQIALGNSFTLEYWVKNNGADGTYDRITTTSPTYTFETAKNGAGQLSIYGLGRGWISTGVTISSTGYDHIAWVFDGSTVRLYKNGAEEWSGTGFSPDTRLADWTIGNFVDAANFSIDEARLWNSARTAQEINDNASPCTAVDTQDLIFRFSFDEGSGTTATESVSGAAIAMVGGTPVWENDNVQDSPGVSVTLTVTDPSGNTATGTATVTIEDNIAPTVNLNGDAVINLNQNETFTETATAEDNCSATLDIQGTVDTAIAGTYTLTYKAVDGSGNESGEVTRTVNVVEPFTSNITTFTDPTELQNDGLLVAATNVGANAQPVQVNGICFDNTPGTLTNLNNGGGDFCTDCTPGTLFDELFNGILYQPNGSASAITLTGLVPGNKHRLQLLMSNDHNSTGNNTTFLIEGNPVNVSGWIPNTVNATLEFIASGSTMDIGFAANNGSTANRGIISAYVLHDIDQVGTLCNEPPVASSGGDITASIGESATATISFDGSGSSDDNGIASYEWFVDGNSVGTGATLDTELGIGTFSAELIITDSFGITASEQFSITINDATDPIVVTQDITVELDANGNATITPQDVDNGSSDNSGGTLTYTLDQSSFDCNDLSAECISGSLRLNGGNTRVLLPNQIALGNSFTLEYWVKNNGADGVFDRITTTSPTFTFETAKNSGGQLSIYGLGRGWINTGVTISGTEYDHIAWVFDGSTVRLYQNGTEAWSDSGFSADTRLADWAIGNFVDVANASIDEVRLWDSARTVQQINDNASPCGAIDTQGLVFGFSFDEGTGTTATEIVSGDVITIEGGAIWENDNVQDSPGVPVTLTVTDPSGNRATGTATVTIEDNIAPTVNLNGDAVISLNQNETYSETATGEDNCSATLDIQGTVDTATAGTYVLTYKATDGSGNESAEVTRTVTILDVTDPTVITQNITVELDAIGNATITPQDIDNGSSDNSGSVTLSLDITEFNCNNLGVNTVTLTATDASGNSQSGTATVTVQDVTVPNVITQDITVSLDANGNASIVPSQIDNGSDDNCGIQSLLFGVSGDNGGQEVVPVVSGTRNGRELTGISYTYGGETKTLTPANSIGSTLILSTLTAGSGGANRFWDADFNTGMTESKALGVLGDLDLGTVLQDCSDPAGVQHDVMFDTPITPGAGPEIFIVHGSLKQDIKILDTDGNVVKTIDFDINANSSPITIGGSVYDNRFYGFHLRDNVNFRVDQEGTHGSSQNRILALDINASEVPEIGGIRFGGGSCNYIYEILGFQPETASAPQLDFSCDDLGINTVTLQATDGSGNVSTGIANVTVIDEILPTITINGSATVEHDAFTTYTDAGASVVDNCSATLSTIDNVSANVPGSYTVTYTATDASGNETVATRTVIVQDVTDPVAVAQDITVLLDANGNATITPEQINNGSSDDSGNVTLSIDRSDFDCSSLDGEQNNFALRFDGDDEYVSSDNKLGISGNMSRTLEFWMRVDEQDGFNEHIINWGGTSTARSFGFYQSFGAELKFYGFGNPTWDHGTGYIIDQDEWVHVAAVYNGTTVYTYVNGEPTPVPSRDYNLNTADGKLIIAAREDLAGVTFSSLDIDDVRVWNYARSQSQIKESYQREVDGTTPGLILYYDFEDGTGSQTVRDLSNSNNNGRLFNMELNQDWINSGSPIYSGSNPVILTVTDPSGNASTAIANVTVIDEIAPEITAPADINVFATSAAGATVNYTAPVGTDNCSVTTALTAGLEDGATFPIGTTVVTYTATDGSDNATSASFNVTVTGLPPGIVVPADIKVSNDAGECGAVVNYAATEITAIPESTITYDIQPGSFFALGSTTVTATATNAVGTSIDTFTVTVVDSEVPEVITQDVTVDLDVNGNGSITPEQINNGSTDNCSIASYALDIDSFDCSNVGTNTVTLTVTDVNGNSSTNTATVTVRDVIAAEVITQNITIDLDAGGNASITTGMIDNGSNDACGIASFSLDKMTFDCTNVGVNTVTLTVTDNNGNVSSNTVMVTVRDVIAAEVITQDITIDLDAGGNASITTGMIDNGSNDACGIASFSLDKTTFDCTNVGVNTVILTVTDNNGNVSRNTAMVTVRDLIAAEVITKDITIDLDASGNASITTGMIDNGSNDACGIASFSLDKTTFDCTNVGANTVILTVTDNNGNVSSNTATVTVRDLIAAEVITKDITIDLDASGNASITMGMIDNGSNDACGIASFSLDKMTFDCTNVGANTVILTVADNNGNVSSNTATVTVRDLIAAEVITKDITIDLDASGNASITTGMIDNGSNDACGIASFSLDKTTFDCTNVGVNTVTLTVTDNNGNVSSNTATVTVRDIIAPTIITQNIEVFLDENGAASITPSSVNDGTFDNCTFDLSIDKNTFDCFNIGENTVTLTATDASGNKTSATAIVTVTDVILPTIVGTNIEVFVNSEGQSAITVQDVDGGTFDNCGIASVTIDIHSFDCSNLGANTVTLTAIDVNGNVNTGTVTVTVTDIIAPIVNAQDLIVNLNENGSASVSADDLLIYSEADLERDTECELSGAEGHAMWLSKYLPYDNEEGMVMGMSSDIEVANLATHSRGWSWWNWGNKGGHDDDDDDKGGRDDDDDDNGGKKPKKDKAKDARFEFDAAGGSIVRSLDGKTATVTGTLKNIEDDTDKWTVSLMLTGGADWETWSDKGGKWKGNKYTVRNNYRDWTYYELASGTLTGRGRNTGEIIQLDHAPTDHEYGFQLGDAANDKNGNYGLSGWISYTNREGKKQQGDFNFNVSDCGLVAVPAGTVYTSDNCGISSTSVDIDSFSCTDLGTNTVNVSVTDQSGNITTVPVTVTVQDNIAPTAVALDYVTVSLGADGTVMVDPSMLDGGSYDNTDCITFSIDRMNFDCDDIGRGDSFYTYEEEESCRNHKHTHGKGHNYGDDDDDNDPGKGKAYGHKKSKKTKLKGHRVMLTVTDAAGNSDQVETYVVVVDALGPVIAEGPVMVVVYDETYGRGRRSYTKKNTEYVKDDDIEPLVSDNCEVYKIDFPRTKYSSDDAGMNQLEVTAKDKSGNVTVGMVNVEVIDITDLGKYVEMCYKGRSVRIKNSSVQDYLRKGASLGSCGASMNTQNQSLAFGETEERFVAELNIESYPNPTTGFTTISISSNVEGPAKVGLVSTSGVEIEEIYSGELQANEKFEVGFDGSNLPSGVYIVRLVTAGQVKNLKLMINK